MDLSKLFQAAPPKIIETAQTVENDEPLPLEKKVMTLEEVRKRDDRTVFIGNVPINTDKKELEKIFKKFGKIEKIWVRNVPVEINSKAPIKAKVIQNKLGENAVNKNCYVLFELEEHAKNAVENTQSVQLEGRHLKITLAGIKEKDFKTTVFVGNVTFSADEEKIREFFLQFGVIEDVRLVRDRITHQPKGFCYVRFADKLGFLKCLQQNGIEFCGRSLRINKAVKNPSDFFDFDKKDTRGVEKAIKKLRHDKPDSRKNKRAEMRSQVGKDHQK